MIRTSDGTWGFIPAMHESIGDGSEALRLVNMQLGGMLMIGATIPLDATMTTSVTNTIVNPADEMVVAQAWEAYIGGEFQRDPTSGFLVRAMATGARHGMLASQDFATAETADYLRWHRDSMGSHWIVDWRREGPTAQVFALHRPLGEEFRDTDVATLRILCGHLLLADRLETARPVQEADGAWEPVFLIDARMRVHHLNAGAERLLAADNGFRMAGPRLSCEDVDAETALQVAVAAAASLLESPEPRFVSVPGQRTGRPHIAAITTVRLASGAGLQRGYGARVRVIDTAAPPTTAVAESYRRLFDLTMAERRVAEALMTGGDALPVVAARCGISYHTVRTHVARLLAKTGTKGIPELVRLLSRLD